MNRIVYCSLTASSSEAAASGSESGIAQQLITEGFDVQEYDSSNLPGVDTLKESTADLIILEVDNHAYTDSYSWFDELKRADDLPHMPILLIGYTDSENGNGVPHSITLSDTDFQNHFFLIEGVHNGAADYIRFPFHIAELLAKIKSSIRVKQTLEQAKSLADQVHEANNELIQRNLQVEKEMYMARQLQQSLLPPAILEPDETNPEAPFITRVHVDNEKIKVSGVYLPCDALGGDLYDVIPFHDNAMGVAIADVSGHGLAAGFVTAIFKTSLYRSTHIFKPPSEVVNHLNNELCDIVKTGDYVTGVYLRIELDTLEVTCTGAGHPYPFLYRKATDEMIRLQENSTPLAWVKDMPYPEDNITLQSGDKIYLFTDGVTELRNMSGEMFEEQRLNDLLLQSIRSGSPYINDDIISHLSDFTEGRPLEDDLSMVIIEAK